MNPARIAAIARKEFYSLIRDYRSLYLAFAMPLILILLFGYALSLDVDRVETVVVDYSRSAYSRDLIGKLGASPYFRLVAQLSRSEDAESFLDDDRAAAVIVIPPDFARKLHADRDAPIQIIIDGSDPNFAGIVRGYLTAFIEQYNRKLLGEFLNRQGRETIALPVDGRIRIWFNEDLESRHFIVPGIIAIIIIIVGALLTSLVIAREYENETMETIKSLPIGAGEFLLGKAIPYFFIALADVLVAMVLGQILFGVVIKASFWLMILATSLYLMVALALGLLISSVTKTQTVANQLAILITYLPSILLSNFVFPIVNMPHALQILTYIVPARYYIELLAGLYLRNTTWSYLWPDMAVLALMMTVLAAANFILLRREGL